MKEKSKYIIGVLIAIGLYIASNLLGSILNVILSLIAGYSKYSDFASNLTVGYAIIMLVISVANHTLMSYLTVKVMAVYGKRKNCLTTWYFRIAAIAVVITAVLIVPMVVNNRPGAASYIIQALGILFFSKKQLHKSITEGVLSSADQFSTKESLDSSDVIGTNDVQFCHMCGSKLQGDSVFCSKCGTKVN